MQGNSFLLRFKERKQDINELFELEEEKRKIN